MACTVLLCSCLDDVSRDGTDGGATDAFAGPKFGVKDGGVDTGRLGAEDLGVDVVDVAAPEVLDIPDIVPDIADVPDVPTASDVPEEATAIDAVEEATPTASCGDGQCASDESCKTCPADCGACPKPPCQVLGAVNCEAGEQCFPNGNVTFCAKAGALEHGKPCKYYNDCAVGALCAAGQCRTLCDYSGLDATYQCKPGVPCEKLLVPGSTAPPLGVCKPGANCDPLTDQGCANNNCVPTGWLKTCVVPGPGGTGAPCASASDCQLGTLCVANACRPKCSTQPGGTPKCADGTCAPVLGPDGQPVPGDVGTCL